MKKHLYYIDGYDVRELPWTRERDASVYPIFYATRVEALKVLRLNLLTESFRINQLLADVNEELKEQ